MLRRSFTRASRCECATRDAYLLTESWLKYKEVNGRRSGSRAECASMERSILQIANAAEERRRTVVSPIRRNITSGPDEIRDQFQSSETNDLKNRSFDRLIWKKSEK
ncbi:hypothetical protein NPIL_640541 [Nephila pilipes]|uniref:Uncharacterized protein n=1 Tax=Nephila pilipes TaxID=299642 RepID=A0A8X6MVS0_NEPPI|nr:hypothetical protein NPIL_640541 [Nephila pilipes]